uniref:Uncharacterized protein n=1 Tax=Zooxanthella nutricula TaxID=1333877 RepID=A0A7S2QA52_9DINO
MLKLARGPSEVLDLIEPYVGSNLFNEIHVAAAFFYMGEYSDVTTVEEGDFAKRHNFMSFVQRAKGFFPDHDPFQLRNIIGALGRLSVHAASFSDMLPDLVNVTLHKLPSFSAWDAANALWGIAKARRNAPVLLALADPLAQRFAEQAPRANAHDISNAVWAAGVLLGRESDSAQQLIAASMPAAHHEVGQMTPQALCNVCTGLAMLGTHDGEWMRLVSIQVSQSVRKWRPENVCKSLPGIVWAYARLDVKSTKIVEATAKVAGRVLCKTSAWGVLALLGALRKVGAGHQHEDLLR